MPGPLGGRRWAIAEGCIPSSSHGPEPQMTSDETACLLNAGDHDARVMITLYFADREPAGPYRVTVPAPHTRLDSRQEELGLLTTIAYAAD